MARKISGGRYRKARKKKLAELPGKPREVKLGTEQRKRLRLRGGAEVLILLSTDKAIVLNPKTKRVKKVKIRSVISVPSNRYLKSALVKGAIIDTEAGKARITNRPSREGSVLAVLIS